ncbi:MAG: lactate utilization protein B [Sulfolobales archaeon]
MSSWFESYKDEVTKELENEVLKVALERFSRTYWNARNNALRKLPYYNYYRKRVREIKAWSIEHLDELVKMTKESVESLGGSFYLANNAGNAVEYISKVCESSNAKLVVKSKSMVTEELSLNEVLIEKGIEVVETDLGEWIIQLRSEKPSHIIYPAIHLTTEEIARTFSKTLNMEVPSNASKLVGIAREKLRQKFINADVGISGANVIAAETGTVLIIENEGNARFATNAPPVHICVSGIEKIVPTVEDAILVSRVITPNATGQLMPVYISLITGPSRTADIELKLTLGVHGPKEFHMVLVDNGRSKMVKDPDFKEASYCIRCGACLSDCPVYREIGGIVWSYKYMGGIGAIWTTFTHGLEKAAPIAFTCTTCGRCKAICPMEIDTPRMILKLREKLLKAGLTPKQLLTISENIKVFGNPFGIAKKAE